jgi:hypothetical protein
MTRKTSFVRSAACRTPLAREATMAAELHEQACALIARLRTPRVTHHQISDEWEPYKTVQKTHPLDPIREEAADMIERLLAAASAPSQGGEK